MSKIDFTQVGSGEINPVQFKGGVGMVFSPPLPGCCSALLQPVQLLLIGHRGSPPLSLCGCDNGYACSMEWSNNG